MSLCLNPILEVGQLNNSRSRSTHGFLQLKDAEMPYLVELTGDFFPDLQGKCIQFSPNPRYATAEEHASTLTAKQVHQHQVGTTGIMTAARWTQVPTVSEEEVLDREAAGQPVPYEWKRVLYLEWFCQNGRVVLELIEPYIQVYVSGVGDDEVWEPFEWPDTKPDDPMAIEEFDTAAAAREAVPFGQPYNRPKMDGSFSLPSFTDDEDDDDEPFQDGFDLIKELERMEQEAPSELDAYLDDLNRQRDEAAGLKSPDELFDEFCDEEDDEFTDEEQDVDDLIAEMEYMDEVMEGKHDSDPHVVDILANYVTGRMTDGEAEIKLKEILAQLALYGISVSICEHFSAKDTLRIIRDEWGLQAKIHQGLIGSGWVRGFMTSESCHECDALFEQKYRQMDHEDIERRGREWMEEQERERHSEGKRRDADGDVPF